MATAKQRAAKVLFAKRAKSGYFKRKKKAGTRKTRVKSRVSRSRSAKRVIKMAKRKTTRRRSRGLNIKSLGKKIALGIGLGVAVGVLTAKAAPALKQNPMLDKGAKALVGLTFGGPLGALGAAFGEDVINAVSGSAGVSAGSSAGVFQ